MKVGRSLLISEPHNFTFTFYEYTGSQISFYINRNIECNWLLVICQREIPGKVRLLDEHMKGNSLLEASSIKLIMAAIKMIIA